MYLKYIIYHEDALIHQLEGTGGNRWKEILIVWNSENLEKIARNCLTLLSSNNWILLISVQYNTVMSYTVLYIHILKWNQLHLLDWLPLDSHAYYVVDSINIVLVQRDQKRLSQVIFLWFHKYLCKIKFFNQFPVPMGSFDIHIWFHWSTLHFNTYLAYLLS